MEFSAKAEALLRSLFGVDDSGQIFIRLVEGEPTSDLKNAVNSQSSRSLETLLSNSIVLDSTSLPALRFSKVAFGETVEAADAKRRTSMLANLAANQAAQAKVNAKKE